eukprot:COSAG06_NODE_1057_length_10905_cov_6.405793_3_plen_73_part_00
MRDRETQRRVAPWCPLSAAYRALLYCCGAASLPIIYAQEIGRLIGAAVSSVGGVERWPRAICTLPRHPAAGR